MSEQAHILNMDTIVEVLIERGVPAYVEHTGGGVATIYAGEQRQRRLEQEWPTFSVIAGPGTLRHRDYGFSTAWSHDFYVGPDMQDIPLGVETTIDPRSNEVDVANLIVDKVREYDDLDTCPFIADKDGDVWEGERSDGGWVCISIPSMKLHAWELLKDHGPLSPVYHDPRSTS